MFWWAIHFCRFLPSPYLFFGLCWDAQTPHALVARTNLIKLTIFEMGVEEMTPIRNRETLLSSVKLSLKRSHRKRAAPPIKTLLRRTLNGFLLEKKARRKSGPHFNFKFQLVAITLGAFSILAPPTFKFQLHAIPMSFKRILFNSVWLRVFIYFYQRCIGTEKIGVLGVL